MVTDQRVSRLLEQRLGGIYRDPARVNRDASIVLKSSIGQNLQPIVTLYADETTGDTMTILDLQGMIAIHYRGQTYQLLMDIYIIDSYPIKPPVCYVRLVPNMYIKENHKHVQADTGRVFIPYLSEWNAASHNLIELIVAISSIFSNDPPVFSRPPPKPQTTAIPSIPPPVQQQQQQSSYLPSTNASPQTSSAYNSAPSSGNNNNNNNNNNNWRVQQQQLEAALALEAEEANRAVELARQNERTECERQNAIQIYESTQKQHLHQTLTAKIQTYCREQRTNIQQHIVEDYHDSAMLSNVSTTHQQQIQVYQTIQNQLQHQIRIVDEKSKDIQSWLQQQHAVVAVEEPISQQDHKSKSIDDIVIMETNVQEKMIQYEAENNTISDIMYFLDKALYEQTISIDIHLKHIRTLAKQQFLNKAHFLKLQQQQQQQQ